MLNNNNTNTSNQNQIPNAKARGSLAPMDNSLLPQKKKGRNKVGMALGLIIIAFVAVAGVSVSLRQFFVRETVAPTAPTESQASVEQIMDCSIGFNVAEPETGISCQKWAYQDELSNSAGNYDLVTQQDNFEPGDIVVYSFEVSNDGEVPTTITAVDELRVNVADDVIFDYQFLDSNCGPNAFSTNPDRITCVAEDLGPGESETFTFRVKLSSSITQAMTITNMVQIEDGQDNSSCQVDVDVEIPGENFCGDPCSSSGDCAEGDHICYDGVCRLEENPTNPSCEPEEPGLCGDPCSSSSDCAEGDHICYDGVCRLEENPTNPSCEPEEPSYCGDPCSSSSDCAEDDHVCYDGICRLEENPTNPSCQPATPEGALCGEYCDSNNDCVESDHICYFNQCRLASHPDRTNCSVPPQVTTTPSTPPVIGCNETCISNGDCSNQNHICFEGRCRLDSYPTSTTCTVPTEVVTTQQPKLPETLPESGSDDLINWIKAGIGILGAGALLLLL